MVFYCFVDVCLFRAVVPVRDQDEDVRSSFKRHNVPPQSRPHCLCQQRGHLGKAAGYFHDPSIIKNRITAAKNHLRCEYLDLPAGDSPCKPERSSLDSLPQCISWFVIAKFSSNENHNCDNDDYDYNLLSPYTSCLVFTYCDDLPLVANTFPTRD